MIDNRAHQSIIIGDKRNFSFEMATITPNIEEKRLKHFKSFFVHFFPSEKTQEGTDNFHIILVQ